MTSQLEEQIAEAVLTGRSVDQIERQLIDPAPLDADHKSALWLYAYSLHEQLDGRCCSRVPVIE